MRIAIVTDAWAPQVNGVVRTLGRIADELRGIGHEVEVISPDGFRTMPCPSYPEIRLALFPGGRLAARLEAFAPDAIHIATEGPLGMAARRCCLRTRRPFTTSFHTKFPEYVHARTRLPVAISYAWLRRFHRPAARVMVATDTVRRELAARGFANTKLWCRGVDTSLFRPRRGREGALAKLPPPVFLYVGRVAVEKNISAFLDLELPGTKVVVGDGPQLGELRQRHPEAHFAGAMFGEDLARHYASADVFVFPSRTDTFGLVMLEALASGVPVAAYPVPGPLDVIGEAKMSAGAAGGPVGVLDNDLGRAARGALAIPSARCRAYAQGFSWHHCAELFLSYLAPIAHAGVGVTAPMGPPLRAGE